MIGLDQNKKGHVDKTPVQTLNRTLAHLGSRSHQLMYLTCVCMCGQYLTGANKYKERTCKVLTAVQEQTPRTFSTEGPPRGPL